MKKLLVLVFAIALCLGVLCLGASADYSGTPEKPAQGDGTVDDPYKISSAENLYWFAGLVNGTLTDVEKDTDAHAVLTDNITINTGVLKTDGSLNSGSFTQWAPICGKKIGDYDYTEYTGTFDGQGYTISGLYYDGSGKYVGLFGYVGSSGRVQNVNVADSYISSNNGARHTGGVCGHNRGTITNCSFSGNVTCNNSPTYVGGVCGWNAGTTENCYNAGSVTSVGSYTCVGGVCGYNGSGSTIRNCYNTGAVNGENTGDGYFFAGGVCGSNDSLDRQSTITNCYNTGSVTVSGSGTNYVGGVCGDSVSYYNTGEATITDCYNIGEVSGTTAGGVCGWNSDGTIKNCYWLSGKASSGIGKGTATSVEAKTDDEFKSGEVTWLLNGGTQMNGPWRQDLSVTSADDFPVLDNNKPWVHYNGTGYENGIHAYNNGFCVCGAYEPAKLDGGVYQIGNAGQLYWFAQTVNEGDYDANAKLTKNITINENVLKTDGTLNRDGSSFTQWTPIGNSDNRAYTGTFDGGNHTISGLYYDGGGEYVGLFGYVGSNGRVQNVNIADSYIGNNNRYGSTGGVCGDNNGGTITNCYNTGTVKGLYYTGGVCGRNRGMITNCSFSGSVTCEDTSTYVGGVCGNNLGTIENSYNAGTVTSIGSDTYVGGVCGFNNTGSTIRNCYNTGAVNGEKTGNGYFYAGGVCGNNASFSSLQSSTITNCYNTGSVTVSVTGSGNGNICAGGVCGFNSEIITNCYNIGSVTGSGTDAYVGGVCGYNNGGTITNCYNIGEVSGTTAGGVCGENSNGKIENCYWQSGTADEADASAKTTTEFASGEVAWLLNQGQTNDPWRQTLSDERDDYPVLDSTHEEVVKLTVDSAVSYLNEGDSFTGETNKAYFKDETAIELPYIVNEDTELTSAAIYTVTVVYDNGTAEKTEQVVDGKSFKLPAAPSKSGYTFVGWSDGTNTYDPGDSVPITGNVTFTAVWQAINIPDPNGITVTQPANGTIRVNPSNGSTGTLITVTATPDEGYELAYITVDGEEITGNTFKMPDKAVTVSAVFVPVTFPFTDVTSGDWFYDYVAYVYSNGLMDGTSATAFEPNANMTRAMVWTIIARIDGETVTGAAWADTARAWAMAEGVSDGTDPNGLVTREQFATMLYRYAVAKGYDVSIGESTNILSYADFASISEYAIPAMQWACGSGIVTGVTDSTLSPQGTATRAQCAAMLMRFVEL